MDVDKTLKKARRFKKEDSKLQADNPSDKQIPSIPNHVLDRIRPKSSKRDLVLWRGIWNREGRVIRTDELTEPSTDNKDPHHDGKKRSHDDNSSVGSSHNNRDTDITRKGKCFKKKKGRRVKLRRTHTSRRGIPDASVVVSMKDSDDSSGSDDHDDDSSQSDNDETPNKNKALAKKKKTKSKGKKARRFKRLRRNPVTRQGRPGSDKPRAIIDPGTELDVIGGVGWRVLSTLDNQSAYLDGALEGMGECTLLLVNTVTAYDHPTEGAILLGAGSVGWNKRATQTEALFNSHDMRKHGITAG
jgi:hypothetical protein